MALHGGRLAACLAVFSIDRPEIVDFWGSGPPRGPRDPLRSTGPAPHINLHKKSAPKANSKAISRVFGFFDPGPLPPIEFYIFLGTLGAKSNKRRTFTVCRCSATLGLGTVHARPGSFLHAGSWLNLVFGFALPDVRLLAEAYIAKSVTLRFMSLLWRVPGRSLTPTPTCLDVQEVMFCRSGRGLLQSKTGVLDRSYGARRVQILGRGRWREREREREREG